MKRKIGLRVVAPLLSLGMITLGVPVALSEDNTSTPAGQGPVTFTRDVAPILHSKCVSCHRPGETAPMALRDFEEVRPWIKSIKKAVSEKTMPPWHADPHFGRFTNNRSLSEAQIATISRWIDSGAPKGDPEAMPPMPKFPEGWRLGEPDYTIKFEKVELSAGGPDIFKELPAEINIPEDRWIRAIEVHPGNRKVVHHVIAFMSDPKARGGPGGWLGAWAAGMEPMVFPEGTGRLIKKGAKVVADMHFHPAEAAATDQTEIGLYFAPKALEKEVINLWIQNGEFMIPAGDANHEVKSAFTFEQDSHILGLLPHMHYRGKDFTYTAHYPDGREEVILKVNNYDFNWQTVYKPEKDIAAPKGTRIDCVAHFDNSKNNPHNPDPNKDVRFGNQSFDEMMIGFVDYIVDKGVRPKSAVESIDEKLGPLAAAHPGEVYAVEARSVGTGEEQAKLPTILHLPSKGEGTWLIPINGQLVTSTVSNVMRIGPGFTAHVKVPGQGTVMTRGTLDAASGTIKGKIYMQDKPVLEYDGTLAK